MEYQGKVKNGVVVLDGDQKLPEGTPVRVSPIADSVESVQETEGPNWTEVLKDVIGKGVGLPSDLAENHDHYLHGLPRK